MTCLGLVVQDFVVWRRLHNAVLTSHRLIATILLVIITSSEDNADDYDNCDILLSNLIPYYGVIVSSFTSFFKCY